MAKQDSSRGIRLSRNALLRARKVKCVMTQEMLANKIGVHVREIQRAEAEQNIDPAFADAIAQALREELTDLVKEADSPPDGEPPQAPSSPPPMRRIVFEEHHDGSFMIRMTVNESCPIELKPRASQIAAAIGRLLNFESRKDGDDLFACEGSIHIEFRLSLRDTAKLIEAFIAGQLKPFNVVAISASIRRRPEHPFVKSRVGERYEATFAVEETESGLKAQIELDATVPKCLDFVWFGERVESGIGGLATGIELRCVEKTFVDARSNRIVAQNIDELLSSLLDIYVDTEILDLVIRRTGHHNRVDS
jgi:DNA-binding XRE family transcriptional regulator